MSKQKKLSSQTQPHHNDLSDDSLSNEWQVHNNRLNFLEQSLTKIQKKMTKLQKSIILVSQSSNELKDDFRSKLNEMIGIVSQPQLNEQNFVSIDQFNQIMAQFKNISNNQSEWIFKCQNLQRQIHKLAQKTSPEFNPREIQDYINDRVALAQQKNKKFMQDKISELSKTLHNFEKSIPFTKNESVQNFNRIMEPQSNNFLNNSAFSKANSSQNGLSNSRSQNKLSNSSSSNMFDYSDPVRESMAKRLNFTQSQQRRRYPDSAVSSQKSNQQGAPTNENNSRVVYLRQKLKEFQEINKKYEKKESQYDTKQKEILSNYKTSQNQRNASVKKNSSSLYTCHVDKNQQQIQPQEVSHSQQSHIKTIPRETKKGASPLSSYRQDSSSKKYSNFSSTKSHVLSHQSSANKVDKLKSIKDYLEQTESQIDESFLEPNYNNHHM